MRPTCIRVRTLRVNEDCVKVARVSEAWGVAKEWKRKKRPMSSQLTLDSS